MNRYIPYQTYYYNILNSFDKIAVFYKIFELPMNLVKDLVMECDFFAHGTLQRYRHGDSFSTLTGGVVSVVWVSLFVGMFASLTIDTFQNNIVLSSTAVTFDDDPSAAEITASPDSNFMFAVGLTGINLSASQRYFDISLAKRQVVKNGTSRIKTKTVVPLQACTLAHWQGMGQSISNSFSTLGLNQWLCPPINFTASMQGKYTSNFFNYFEVKIDQCTVNSLFPGTTCYNSTDIDSFLNIMAQFTFNFYYVNPVINAGEKTYISHYLEDRNYFSFDTYTGVSANLFFNQYDIQTDTTILPWQEYKGDSGVKTDNIAVGQNYKMTTGDSYFKFYLRKGAASHKYIRSFQKLDQTLSYIGGLFGTLALFLMFLNTYSKYCYELDFGDRIFKQNNGGSFGSENFNFIVFLGYFFFVVCTKFGIVLNWKSMKRYHQCRTQCEKQLDIDLLLRKVNHFQQISKVILEDHHQKMLLMIPKPTIQESRINRKKFIIKSMIYNQLQKKAGEIHVDREEFSNKVMKFVQAEQSQQDLQQGEDQDKELNNPRTLKNIQGDIAECYRKVKEDNQDDPLSQKIMEKINFRTIAQGILGLGILQFGKHERMKSIKKSNKFRIEDFVEEANQKPEEEYSAQALFRSHNRVANSSINPLQLFNITPSLQKNRSGPQF